MIGALTTNAYNNVPNRHIVKPVRAIPQVYLETQHSNANYEKHNSGGQSRNNSANFSTNGFNPFFAAHILSEAGLGGEENNLVAGNRAYAKKKVFAQNTIAIA